MSQVRVGYNIEKKLDAPPVPPPSRNITIETPNNLSKPMTKTPSAKKKTKVIEQMKIQIVKIKKAAIN